MTGRSEMCACAGNRTMTGRSEVCAALFRTLARSHSTLPDDGDHTETC